MLELTCAVVLLLVASAISSGTEAAIFSLPLTKAKQLAEKSKTGKVICDIREKPARPISTIVIFNNIANIVGTYFVAYLATSRLSPNVQSWFPFALTALVILLSEIIPKNVGERYSSRICLFVARPLAVLTWLLTPVVWGIEKITSKLVRDEPPPTTHEAEATIRFLTKIGHEEGVIEKDERQMIERVFKLNDHTAKDIMTPRTEVSFIRSYELLKDAIHAIGISQHSRLLVVGETVDQVKGVIFKSSVLKLIVEGYDEDAFVEDYMEPVPIVQEFKKADRLLEEFQKSRTHLAVVVDEYGGVAGVVTLEDCLEVITGEIVDETDVCEDMREQARENGRKRLKNGNQLEKSADNRLATIS